MKINILKKLRKKAIKKYSIVFYIIHGVGHYEVIDNTSYFSVEDKEFNDINDALNYLGKSKNSFYNGRIGVVRSTFFSKTSKKN